MNRKKEFLVIKIGGQLAENKDHLKFLAAELIAFRDQGYGLVLVHGGGPGISSLQKRYGWQTEFRDGLRQTPAEHMPLVDMVLAGAVNKKLVRLLQAQGLDAWGLCGADAGLIRAESIDGPTGKNRTGVIQSLRKDPLELLIESGYLPVLAPPASDQAGRALNVNADETALALAIAVAATGLIFLSDVPGVLEEGRIIPYLNPVETEKKITNAVIKGGMIPKIRASLGALEQGVKRVYVADYTALGNLKSLLSGERGTLLSLEPPSPAAHDFSLVNKKDKGKEVFVHNPPFPKQYGEKFLVFDYGKGCRLYDRSGKSYLDMGAGIAVNALGYGRRDLVDLAAYQMNKLIHTSNLYTSEPVLKLSARMLATPAPHSPKSPYVAVHFSNSGTEANESALKYARLYARAHKGTEHHRFLGFSCGFHGRSMGALSVSSNFSYRDPFTPLIPGSEILPFNDVKSLEEGFDKSVAAVLVEVVQGEGGLETMQAPFAQALNELCRRYNALLIVDEVQTGLGRCGTFYASEKVGLEPDMITLAKPLAGGLPLSAVMIPEKVNALLKPGHHGSTFGGGPVSTTVALAVWNILSEPTFLAETRRKGEKLAALLQGEMDQLSLPYELHGMGLLQGLRLIKEEDHSDYCHQIIEACQEAGLIILKTGRNGLRLSPPLVIQDKEIEEGVALLGHSIKNIIVKRGRRG